jgi:hypothetical protein
MIRYAITRPELEAAVERAKRGWLKKATQKTETFRTAGDFNEPDSKNSWSEIKSAFIQLQNNKCAYCERQLGHDRRSRIEHDVEHFRPKNAVKLWPADGSGRKYRFATGDASDKGYYLLAYNIFNYTTSCKTCNSTLKSNFFPVYGSRLTNTDDFAALKAEKHLLVYPLGDLDTDPESLITFQGVLPVPKVRSGEKYRRARVTIDFFELDTREDLNRQRAGIILSLWLAHRVLQIPDTSDEDRADARRILDLAISSSSAHTNCARAFAKLCRQDVVKAREFKERAAQIVQNS